MKLIVLIELFPIILGILVIIFNERLLAFYTKFDKGDGSVFPREGRKTRVIIVGCILILFGLVGMIESLS